MNSGAQYFINLWYSVADLEGVGRAAAPYWPQDFLGSDEYLSLLSLRVLLCMFTYH